MVVMVVVAIVASGVGSGRGGGVVMAGRPSALIEQLIRRAVYIYIYLAYFFC